jgi:hypothetical protein
MQATMIGVTRMSGIGKESKAKYDMTRALILNPIAPFEKENFKREGFGFEVIEVEMSADCLPFFAVQKFPLAGNFDVVNEVRGGKLAPVIVGMVASKAA